MYELVNVNTRGELIHNVVGLLLFIFVTCQGGIICRGTVPLLF